MSIWSKALDGDFLANFLPFRDLRGTVKEQGYRWRLW